MPALLIVFLSLALTDVYHQKVGKKLKVTFLTQKSYLSDQLLSQVDQTQFNVQVVNEFASFEDYVDKHKQTDAIVFFPEDLGQSIRGSESSSQILIHFNPLLDFSYKELLRQHIFIGLQSLVLKQVNEQLSRSEEAKQSGVSVINLSQDILQEKNEQMLLPNPVQQTVPAWALFAMFFIALPMSASFIHDRKEGILRRLMGYKVSKLQILLGKMSAFFIINVLQFFVMLVLGLFVVPMFTDMSFALNIAWPGLILAVLVSALAATSYGLLVSSLFTSSEQASSFGAIAVVLMALFGGVMIPHFVLPAFMQKLAFLSPLYWGLESFLDIFMRQLSVSSVLPKLTVLLVFSILFLLIALAKFKWRKD